MARAIHLYISSSPDLALEREALGQAVAELPVSVGWEIRHTPRAGEGAPDVSAAVAASDFVLVVLGADFAAPMGLEWQGAASAGKIALAYVKQVLHSPSAQTALREASFEFVPFEAPHELKALAMRALARGLLDHSEHFGLHMSEIEPLLALAGVEATEGRPEHDTRTGAERGGVILGRGLLE